MRSYKMFLPEDDPVGSKHVALKTPNLVISMVLVFVFIRNQRLSQFTLCNLCNS